MPKLPDEKVAVLKHRKQIREVTAQRATDKWLKSITGRFLYEMPTVTMKARNVVDKPVSQALCDVRFQLINDKNKKKKKKDKEEFISFQAIDIATNTMVDGFSVVRLGPGWDFITIEPALNIRILETDAKGHIIFIRIQHLVDDVEGKPVWFRRDYWQEIIKIEDDFTNVEESEKKFFRRDWPLVRKETEFADIEKEGQEEIDEKTVVTEIPFIPFVAFEWNSRHESFLLPARDAFIELERVSIEISGENHDHHTRKLYVTGAPQTEILPADLGERVNILNTGDKAFYPDPHAQAMNSFFKERDDQERFIENFTGVIATEKIATLSGISRIIAMTSLVKLAKKIREVLLAGLIRIEEIFNGIEGVESKELLVLFSPLGMMIVDVNNMSALLKEAKEDGHIDEHEHREIVRMMISL